MIVCRCTRCKALFNEPDIKTVSESRGEFWGFPAYEEVSYAYCPNCGADEDYIDEDYYIDEDEVDLDDLEVL